MFRKVVYIWLTLNNQRVQKQRRFSDTFDLTKISLCPILSTTLKT
jgi:hypothetical protein